MINPKHLQVELTNYCNLQCMECPHHTMERKLAHMSEEVLEKLLSLIDLYDAEEEKLTTIILHKDGEPLMCPSFKEYFARIAERTQAKLDLYTNGILMTPDIVQSMSDSARKNKIWILVSFHNFKYDGTRYDLSRIERNLKACLDLGLPNIEFIISMHKLDQTDEAWTRDFYAKWTNISFERKNLKAIHVNTCINHWAGRVQQQQEMARYPVCPYMDSAHMFIGVTGNVMPCCMDMEEEIVFGNLLEDDLSNILSVRENFYKQHNEREIPHPLCSKCLS